MAIMEVSVLPVGAAGTSVSSFVAGAVRELRRRRLKHAVAAMGTIVEADRVADLLAAAAAMHESVFNAGAARVLTSIRIDDRRDKKVTMAGKVRAVTGKLGGTAR